MSSRPLMFPHSVGPDAPDHYATGTMQPIDAIRGIVSPAEFRAGCLFNVFKYVARYRHKGDPLGDLKKARDYLNWAIESLEQDDGNPD